MKSKESKQNPSKKPGHCRRRISITDCDDGVALPMIIRFFPNRAFRVRASTVFIARFHEYPYGGSRVQPSNDCSEVIEYPNPWFVKVVCTLCIRKSSLDTCSDYFSERLTPSVAFEVIRALNNPKLAFKLFEFSRVNLKINHSFRTYNLLLRLLCRMGYHDLAEAVFDCMRNDGQMPDSSIVGFLVSSFAEAGKFDIAKALLAQAQSDEVDQGLMLWHEMKRRNLFPNEYTYAILIGALCKENRLQEAHDFLRHLKGMNVIPQPFMYNPIIDGFCKAGNVDMANAVVAEMEEKKCKHDKMTYTILIIGHCMKGRMFEAISIFKMMLANGCAPDNITVNSLISCLLKAGMPNEATHIKKTALEGLNLGVSSSKRIIPLTTNTNIPVAVLTIG